MGLLAPGTAMEAAAGCGAGGSSSLGGRPGGICTFAGGGHVGAGAGSLSDLVAGCATGPGDLRAVITGAGSSMTTTTGTVAGGAAADGAAGDAGRAPGPATQGGG